jgi:hypothetical protein
MEEGRIGSSGKQRDEGEKEGLREEGGDESISKSVNSINSAKNGHQMMFFLLGTCLDHGLLLYNLGLQKKGFYIYFQNYKRKKKRHIVSERDHEFKIFITCVHDRNVC